MAKTRQSTQVKKKEAAAKKVAGRAAAKTKRSVKRGLCRKEFSTPSSLRRHKTKKKFPCDPRAVALRKTITRQIKKQRNKLDYEFRKSGATYAMYRRGK